MKVSCLRLADDQSSFYVGYSFSGRVEKYSISSGLLVCSTLAHYGDVHTLTQVRPDVLCTSGSDGHVRLVDMTSNESVVKSPSPKPAVSYSPDELVYRDISNGVMSIRRVDLTSSAILVCLSTLSAPELVNIRNKLDVRSMSLPSNTDVGNQSVRVACLF